MNTKHIHLFHTGFTTMTLVSAKNGGLIPSVLSDFFNAENFFSPRLFPFSSDETIPSANIKETDSQYTIELAAPGYEKKDFSIRLDDDVLTVSAQKQVEKSEEKETYRRKEYSYNSFSRSFTLSKHVDTLKVQASYVNGVMTLVVPKNEKSSKDTAKEIPVQ